MYPHLFIASLATHGSLLAAAKAKTASGASSTIILVVLMIVFVYFLFLRPQRQRARRQQQVQQAIEIGTEVMLTSGIIGRVTQFEGDRARLEIAPGTEITVLRAAIARQLPEPVSDDDIAVRPDAGDGDGDSGESGATPHVNGTPNESGTSQAEEVPPPSEAPPWTWPHAGENEGGT